MAVITELEEAAEEGSYIVEAAFRDENDAAVTPDTATWTLTDILGNTINSRVDVVISPLASTVDILLSGLDLAILPNAPNNYRLVVIEWTYTSAQFGAGIPQKSAGKFEVIDLASET